jgi:hypothetical protein
LFQPEDKPATPARVSFFILDSSQDSIALGKRLLELANEKISKKLKIAAENLQCRNQQFMWSC